MILNFKFNSLITLCKNVNTHKTDILQERVMHLNYTLLHFATDLLLQKRKYPESHVMQCIRYSKSPDKNASRSQAVMPDLMIWKQILLSHDKDVA